MADITMCDNKECPRRDSCYRFTAVPNPYRQSYWYPTPDHADCKGYWLLEINEENDKAPKDKTNS